jgi:hypothetical protein
MKRIDKRAGILILGLVAIAVGIDGVATADDSRGAVVAILLGTALVARTGWLYWHRRNAVKVGSVRATGFKFLTIAAFVLVAAILGVTGIIPPSTGGRYLFIPLFAAGAAFTWVGLRLLNSRA